MRMQIPWEGWKIRASEWKRSCAGEQGMWLPEGPSHDSTKLEARCEQGHDQEQRWTLDAAWTTKASGSPRRYASPSHPTRSHSIWYMKCTTLHCAFHLSNSSLTIHVHKVIMVIFKLPPILQNILSMRSQVYIKKIIKFYICAGESHNRWFVRVNFLK